MAEPVVYDEDGNISTWLRFDDGIRQDRYEWHPVYEKLYVWSVFLAARTSLSFQPPMTQ